MFIGIDQMSLNTFAADDELTRHACNVVDCG